MSFHIGQKVVCVDDLVPENQKKVLIRGAIYTVSAIGLEFGQHYIGCAETPLGSPLQWRRERFRPITERKTDISIFKRILADCDQRVDAPCDVEA